VTLKFTVTPERGVPPTVTMAVTVCDVPAGLLADAGVSVQLTCGCTLAKPVVVSNGVFSAATLVLADQRDQQRTKAIPIITNDLIWVVLFMFASILTNQSSPAAPAAWSASLALLSKVRKVRGVFGVLRLVAALAGKR
jgi:hypothetical protein